MTMEATNLRHHFLIAMPEMADSIFAGTVTYIFDHDSDGAMGLIVNRPLNLDMGEIFDSVAISNVDQSLGQEPVFYGGPVSSEQGFILHRPTEQLWRSSLFNDHLAMTTSQDILESIAEGNIREYLFCLGYSGWSKGQLENELKQNAWLTVKADANIVFDANEQNKYQSALALLGVDLTSLAGKGGHA